MARRRVEVDIVARDKFSGVLAGISSAITSKTLDGVSGAIGKIGEQFNKALDMETINLRGGNDLFALGVSKSFEDGMSQYKSYVDILAKEARNLPGETTDYIKVFQGSLAGLVTSMQKQGKSYEDIDKEIKKFAKETVPNLSILQQADSTLQNKDVKAFSDSYLRGESLKSLEQREMLAKSPVFAQKLREAEASGLSGIDAINNALARTVTPELKNAMRTSFSGLIATTYETVFGVGGLFDIGRDLNSKIEGSQSVFEEIKQSFNLLFGSEGTFAKLGKILGLQDNSALSVLYKGIEGFNIWLAKTNGILRMFGEGKASLGFLSDNTFTKGISNFADKISKVTEDIFTNFIINPLISAAENPGATGNLLMSLAKLYYSIHRGILNALDKVDWDKLRESLKNINWAGLGEKIFTILTEVLAFIIPILWKMIPSIIEVLNGIVIVIISIGSQIIKSIFKFIGATLTLMGLLFKNGWTSLTNWISEKWEGIKSGISSAIAKAGSAIISLFGWMTKQIKKLESYAPKNLYDSIFNKNANKSNASSKQANTKDITTTPNKIANTTNNKNISIAKVEVKDGADLRSQLNAMLNEENMRTANV